MKNNFDLLISVNHIMGGKDRFNPIFGGNFGLMIWNNYGKRDNNITIKTLGYFLDPKISNSRWILKRDVK